MAAANANDHAVAAQAMALRKACRRLNSAKKLMNVPPKHAHDTTGSGPKEMLARQNRHPMFGGLMSGLPSVAVVRRAKRWDCSSPKGDIGISQWSGCTSPLPDA